jgi:L-ascorbate metabolism protein UlaG (beta-lactamase superfamily)
MTFSNGVRVLTDPFDDHVGYPVPAVGTDIVTCSHDHFDHGFTQVLTGEFTEIRTAGLHQVSGIRLGIGRAEDTGAAVLEGNGGRGEDHLRTPPWW